MTDNIFNRIKVEIARTYYTFSRYKTTSTFAMLYHENDLNVEQLAIYVRISDKFVKIDEHHYFINFVSTSHEDTFKASQNLLLYLDNYFNSRTSCIAIDTFNSSNSAKRVINQLMQIIKETKRNSYTRIEDEEILDAMV